MAYRSYSKIDYSIYNKPKKRRLEAFNQRFIKNRGGIFALTGPEVRAHYDKYSHILRKLSPFSIFEVDPQTSWDISEKILSIGDKRLRLHPCDICSIFYTSPKRRGKKHGAYRYGHLDFCITGKVLARDHEFLQFLERLAMWDNLKSPFYLETTFSVRRDGKFETGKSVGLNLLEKDIPAIFGRCGWVADNPRNKAIQRDPRVLGGVTRQYWKYAVSYRDGCPMINGFYKFTRGESKNRRGRAGKRRQ